MTNQTAETLTAKIAAAIGRNPGLMTPILASRLEVTEADLLAAWPNDDVVELDAGDVPALIRAFEAFGRVHLICSNAACVMESVGTFGDISIGGGFLNVQKPPLDMHITINRIARAFAMVKPSHMDGQQTYSVQLYQANGASAFKVFLYKSLADANGDDIESKVREWESVRLRFAKK